LDAHRDLATIDEDGYCNIVGRLKDMVIRGGENIYPREIEEFLYRHPNVQDVQVIGVPDARYGEELCAWIRLREGANSTAEEIRDFCRGQISHYKIPRHIKFVESFPMTVTGKIQKYLMREESIKELVCRKRRLREVLCTKVGNPSTAVGDMFKSTYKERQTFRIPPTAVGGLFRSSLRKRFLKCLNASRGVPASLRNPVIVLRAQRQIQRVGVL
jgi:hypothetical protein